MTVAPTEPETKRYTQLANWLWELGVCWRSRHVLAVAQIEREKTGGKERAQVDCPCAAECKANAARGWKTMPALEAANK